MKVCPNGQRRVAMRRTLIVTALMLAAMSAGGAVHAGDDINSMDEALAKAGTCIYPPGYIDTLAQGSMAPPREAAPAARDTDALIARALAARAYAGGMTALPVPLTTLIARTSAGG
jgi:hypothetical protein